MERRTCRRCGHTKDYTNDYFRKPGWICRECEREAARRRTYKNTRGISYEERDALLKAQGGVCASCGTSDPNSKKGWHVDHCHATEVIRSVLCANCNIALGMVGDSVAHLEKLIEYLRKHKVEGATTIP